MKGIREREREKQTQPTLSQIPLLTGIQKSRSCDKGKGGEAFFRFLSGKKRESVLSVLMKPPSSPSSPTFLVHFSSFFPFAAAPKDGEKEGWGREGGNRKGKIRKREEDRYNSCVPPSSLLFRIKVGGERGRKNFWGSWGNCVSYMGKRGGDQFEVSLPTQPPFSLILFEGDKERRGRDDQFGRRSRKINCSGEEKATEKKKQKNI